MGRPRKTVGENNLPEVKEPSYTSGFVTDCFKLNVRKKPDINSEVVCIKNLNSEFKVDEKKSTDLWYFVMDNEGHCGYCMKKYVRTYHDIVPTNPIG